MIWLTSPRFAQPSAKPEAAKHYPAVGLFWGNGPGITGVYDGPNGRHELPAGYAPELLVLERDDSPDRLPVQPADWVTGVTAVQEAAVALSRGDWPKFGAALDRAYLAERNSLPPDLFRDAAYAAARTAGAWGGRCGEGKLVLLAPPDKREAVRAAAAKYLKGAA